MTGRMLMFCLASIIAVPALSAGPTKAPNPEAEAAYQDIQATFGFVPGFLRQFPETAIASAWHNMKTISLNPKGAVPPKQKELIALGVAAQIPCDYCTYFHTQAARLHGATDDEIKQCLAEASLTRAWSTYVNGIAMDEATWRNEIGRMVANMKKVQAAPERAPMQPARTPEEVLAQAEQMFGFQPTFLKLMPRDALVGMWNEWHAVEMNPANPIPGKYTVLTSLAVSAQVPCSYCVYADTQFATQLEGATSQEIGESILTASQVRHWSTYLNGIQYDQTKFRREVDQIVSHLRRQKAMEAQK